MTETIIDRKGIAKLLRKSNAQIDRYRREGDRENGRPPLNDIAQPAVGRTPQWLVSDVLAWAGRTAAPTEPSKPEASRSAAEQIAELREAVRRLELAAHKTAIDFDQRDLATHIPVLVPRTSALAQMQQAMALCRATGKPTSCEFQSGGDYTMVTTYRLVGGQIVHESVLRHPDPKVVKELNASKMLPTGMRAAR